MAHIEVQSDVTEILVAEEDSASEGQVVATIET